MPAQTTRQPHTATFTTSERRALRALRNRYHQDRDLFSDRERAKLGFLRHLYQSGQLES